MNSMKIEEWWLHRKDSKGLSKTVHANAARKHARIDGLTNKAPGKVLGNCLMPSWPPEPQASGGPCRLQEQS